MVEHSEKMVGIQTIKDDSLEEISYGQAYYRSFILTCPFWFLVFILVLSMSMNKNMGDPTIMTMMMIFTLLTIGFLVVPPMAVLWTKKQQGYHDLWSKTRVIRKIPESNEQEANDFQ
jgi:uncharacterized RDD family membrane protein YckC